MVEASAKTTTTIRLVADTNLFLECKPLDHLPWAELGHGSVQILLTKPVLDELDKHKKASGRTRTRALDIFHRVREMLETAQQESEIRGDSPRVVLRLAPLAKPSPGLSGHLDYSRADEKLVGIVAALHAEAPSEPVALFTDDTGPATTAGSLGVPYKLISESWKHPRPETDEEKKIRELTTNLELYQRQEPAIAIRVDDRADSKGVVTVVWRVPTPLTADEVEAALLRLRERHPLVTDVARPEPSRVVHPSGDEDLVEFDPPAADAIAAYRDDAYPQWIGACRTVLASLHEGRTEPQPRTTLSWTLNNEGTRPASKVRVEFRAKGPLSLRRPLANSGHDDEPASHPNDVPRLPRPPAPPVCVRRVTRVSSTAVLAKPYRAGLSRLEERVLKESHALRVITELADSAKLTGIGAYQGLHFGSGASGHFQGYMPSREAHLAGLIGAQLSPHREPESLYYRDWDRGEVRSEGALSCQLWRHQSDSYVLDFEVVFDGDGPLRGVIYCTVHAENMTRPVSAKVIVRRVLEPVPLGDVVDDMILECK